MAAFTTMALIGLAAGAGMFAGKKLAPKPTTAGNAGTSAAVTPPTPLSAVQSAAANTQQAGSAAKKARRRLAGTAGYRAPTVGQSLITPQVEPRTLIGA
jgi:hypothetical protein